MGFVNGTMHVGSARLLRAAGVLALVSLAAACQVADPVRPKPAIAAAASGPTVPAPPEATQPAVPTVPAAAATFSFDQIKGVPTNKQDSLARSIANYAQIRKLRLVRRTDTTATYHVWGYLSAVGGDVGTNVTYVWDILDQSGNRVLRFSGIEIATAADADPWEKVDESVLDVIAARTVEDVYAWINRLPQPPQAAVQAPQVVKPLAAAGSL